MAAEAATARPVALVVGVGPGIGAAVARAFGKKGYAVAMVSRSAKVTGPLKTEIEAEGGAALAVEADAGDEASLNAAFESVKTGLGNPEVAVYNAHNPGMTWPPPSFADASVAAMRTSLDTGFIGAMLMCQSVLPAMVEAGKGTIIFTGATASLRGSAKFSLLACPKHALRAMAQSVAREYMPKGVHVSHVVIDGQVWSERAKANGSAIEGYLHPDAIAATYASLVDQPKSAWTHELELRPFGEKW